MKFLSRLDDFEHIVIDGSVSGTGLSSLYLKDTATPILRIGNDNGDSFITYDGSELSISSDVDLRFTTPTDQDVFLITSTGNIITTQAGGIFTIGGGLTLGSFGAGLLQTDANGVVSLDTTSYSTFSGDYDDLTNKPTLGTAASSAATDFVAVTGDTMSGNLSFADPNGNTRLNIGNITGASPYVSKIWTGNYHLTLEASGTGQGQIRFNTGTTTATEKMRIEEGGNVGIGTSDPSEKLDVNGGIRAYGSISSTPGNGALLGRYNSGVDIDSGELVLVTDGKTGWDDDVDELGRIRFYCSDGSAAGARDAARITAINGSGNGTNTTTFSGELAFFTSAYNANIAEAMRIDGSGNVGIGTTSPAGKLTISENGGVPVSLVIDSDADRANTSRYHLLIDAPRGTGNQSGIGFGELDNDYVTAAILARDNGTSAATGLDFATGNSAGVNTRMTIDSTGNVGIGNDSPGYRLDVNGIIRTNGGLVDQSGTSNALRIVNPGGASYATTTSSVSGAIQIQLPRGWSDTMLRFTVKIYEYTTKESFEVNIGGYNYTQSGGLWLNNTAYIVGSVEKDRNFKVRFGYVNDKCTVWIGELTDTWSYPQVFVTDFQAGFTSYEADRWNNGWSIDFESTSFSNVNSTISATQVGGQTQLDDRYVNVTGDTMSGDLEVNKTDPAIVLKDGNQDVAWLGDFGGGTDGQLLLFNNSGTATVVINGQARSYLNGGNVGIGTTLPNTLLDVNKATIGEYAYFGSGSTRQLRLSSYNTVSDHAGHKINASSGNGEITLATNSVAALTVKNDQTIQLNSYTAGLLQTDANGNVSLDTTSYSTFSGDYDDLTGKPTLGTASSSAATDFVAVTGDTMSGQLVVDYEGYQIKLVDGSSDNTAEFVASNNSLAFFSDRSDSVDNSDIFFSIDNDTKMQIDTSGNVGIGINGAGTKLHIGNDVSDTIDLSSTVTAYPKGSFIELRNRSGYTGSGVGITATGLGAAGRYGAIAFVDDSSDNRGTGGHIEFYTSGSKTDSIHERMRIDKAGNVGIGTTDPSAPLHVVGNIFSQSGRVYTDALQGYSSNAITLGDGNTALNLISRGSQAIGITGGNVGIGTTSPTTPLHIKDDAPIIRLEDNTSGDTHYLTGNNGELRVQSTGFITMRPGNSVSTTFLANGNVGIGTTSPDYKLDVENLSGETWIRANSATSSDVGYRFARNGVNKWVIYNQGSSDDFEIYQNSATTSRLRITSAGNVGIGTINPTTKLYVDGGESTFNRGNSEGTIARFRGKNTEQAVIGTLTSWFDSNVGIGTTNPTQKLTIGQSGESINYIRIIATTSDFYIGANSTDSHLGVTNGAKILQTNSYPLVIGTTANQELYLGANNAKIATLVDGKFGIGTTTPDTKLHVVGTAETRLRVGSSNASSNVVLELRDENTPTGQGTVITYNNATGETYFNNAMSTATTDFHFQSGEYGTASDFFTLSNSGGNSILHLKTTSGDSFITYEDSTNELAVASDGDLRLTTPTDQDVFFISSGGNIDMTQAGGTVDMGGDLVVDGDVGIGTASPDHKLHVVSSAQCPALFESTTNGGGISLMDSTTTNDAQVGIGAFGDHLCFRSGGSASGNMRLLSNGNLGIGTTTPQAALHINKSGVPQLLLDAGGNTTGDIVVPDGEILQIGHWNNSTSTYTDRLRMNIAGQIGINTQSPNYQLTVVSDSDDIGIVTASTDSGSYIGFIDNSTQVSIMPKVGAVGNKLILSASQYVGVLRTDPSYALDVSGTIRATGDVIAYSDARVKENVETIPNALDKVKAMRGVGYNKIGEEKRSVGVIAQELLEVMPEVVHQDDAGMYSVAYGNIVGVLIEAVKDLEEKVKQLETKLDGSTK